MNPNKSFTQQDKPKHYNFHHMHKLYRCNLFATRPVCKKIQPISKKEIPANKTLPEPRPRATIHQPHTQVHIPTTTIARMNCHQSPHIKNRSKPLAARLTRPQFVSLTGKNGSPAGTHNQTALPTIGLCRLSSLLQITPALVI